MDEWNLTRRTWSRGWGLIHQHQEIHAMTKTKSRTRKTKPSTNPAEFPIDSAVAPVEDSAIGVICTVRFESGEIRNRSEIKVTGTKEYRDPKLQAAIHEYLESHESCSATIRRCEDEVSAAEERESAAIVALDSLITGLGPYAVSYRGMLFGFDSRYDAYPAMPVLTLID
jgi:hypothetical protein